MKVIAATKNPNKVREFLEILPEFEIITQAEAGVDLDVVEDGKTFAENAQKKAQAIFDATGIAALADDSGLEVFALGGEPGIYSARYGGEGLDDAGRVKLLLDNMECVADELRGAQFVCAIALVTADGIIRAEGRCEGSILRAPRGENGFGYDPVFYLEEFGKTAAEVTAEEKNAVSHRGKALRALRDALFADEKREPQSGSLRP